MQQTIENLRKAGGAANMIGAAVAKQQLGGGELGGEELLQLQAVRIARFTFYK